MDIINLLESVHDKETFIKFVAALIEDKNKNENDWRNLTIVDYLDSANAWLEDSGRNDISWKLMAEFLYCGKIYE